jgi:hypothetical protein
MLVLFAGVLVFVSSTLRSACGAQYDWENEQILQRNRLPARATFFPLETVDQAITDRVEESTRRMSLHGPW